LEGLVTVQVNVSTVTLRDREVSSRCCMSVSSIERFIVAR